VLLQLGEVALVQIMFSCDDFTGTISESEESLETRFFEIELRILPIHKEIIEDLILKKQRTSE